MRIAKLAATASALMLMVSPALAATPNPASKLSVTASAKSVRAGSKLKDSSNIAPVAIVIVAVAALVGLGFATGVFDSDDDADSN